MKRYSIISQPRRNQMALPNKANAAESGVRQEAALPRRARPHRAGSPRSPFTAAHKHRAPMPLAPHAHPPKSVLVVCRLSSVVGRSTPHSFLLALLCSTLPLLTPSHQPRRSFLLPPSTSRGKSETSFRAFASATTTRCVSTLADRGHR
jgi:hypothetical protein